MVRAFCAELLGEQVLEDDHLGVIHQLVEVVAEFFHLFAVVGSALAMSWTREVYLRTRSWARLRSFSELVSEMVSWANRAVGSSRLTKTSKHRKRR